MKTSPEDYAALLKECVKYSGATEVARRLARMISDSHVEYMTKPNEEFEMTYTYPEMIKILAILLESIEQA